jgi:hypothetical protein
MRYPSIKTLQAAFPHLSKKDAKGIRAAMEHMSPDAALDRIDQYLGTHGVEGIQQNLPLFLTAILGTPTA